MPILTEFNKTIAEPLSFGLGLSKRTKVPDTSKIILTEKLSQRMTSIRKDLGKHIVTHLVTNGKKTGKLVIRTNNSKNTFSYFQETLAQETWHVTDGWKSVQENRPDQSSINFI